MDMTMVAKHVDSKGRVTLGGAFANRLVLVETRGDEIVLRLARAVPEREAWLFENEEAQQLLRAGLEQARARKLVKGPDLAKARRIADRIRGE